MATVEQESPEQPKKASAHRSFCLESLRDAGPLVEGPDTGSGSVFICRACAELAIDILEDATRVRAGQKPTAMAKLEGEIIEVCTKALDHFEALSKQKRRRPHSKALGLGEGPVSENRLSTRGAGIVKALTQFIDDLEAGVPIESRYTVRKVRVIPKPSHYPPARVRAVRDLIGASQEVFAQLLAVSPMTVRSWEQGLRQPSPIARRFLDEIEMSPGHFRGRILAAVINTGQSHQPRRSKNERPRRPDS
jgi:putative transcriptional regulator